MTLSRESLQQNGAGAPVRSLAPWIWLAWTPWLAVLVLVSMKRWPPYVSALGPALLAASWATTGVWFLVEIGLLKSVVARQLPGLLDEYNVGSLLWSSNSYRMLAVSWDERVKRNPETLERAKRAHALLFGSLLVLLEAVALSFVTGA